MYVPHRANMRKQAQSPTACLRCTNRYSFIFFRSLNETHSNPATAWAHARHDSSSWHPILALQPISTDLIITQNSRKSARQAQHASGFRLHLSSFSCHISDLKKISSILSIWSDRTTSACSDPGL